MKKKQLTLAILLLSAFAALLFFFIKGLNNDPRSLDNTAVGKSINSAQQIHLALPDLFTGEMRSLSDMPPPPYLLNVWGSWCPACYTEHSYLMTLKKEIPIIGLNWHANNPNEAQEALRFLQKLGNPYQQVLTDETGNVIIDLGVYGAPETFLIGADGRILHRYAGPLDANIWQQQFLPLLTKDSP